MKIDKRALILAIFIVLPLLAILSIQTISLTSNDNADVNLTIWDSTDDTVTYTTNNTTFYANWTNLTNGNSINGSDMSCNISFSHVGDTYFNMTFNTTSLLYYYVNTLATGENNFTVNCTDLHTIASINVTEIVNVTNRPPGLAVDIPNIIMKEDTENVTINMSNFFGDDDLHELNYSIAVQDGNITIFVNNTTKFVNVTPIANFYGVRTVNITAFDGFGGNNTSNSITINVTNQIEINLSVPIDGTTSLTSNTPFDILATVQDDYNITSCSLLINNSVNITVEAPDVGPLEQVKYDDGESDTVHRVGSSNHGILTKHLNTTTTDMKFLSFFVETTSTPTNMNISINGEFWRNFTNTEFLHSCAAEPCWINLPITDKTMLVAGENNISFDGFYDAIEGYWRIHVDQDENTGQSTNTGSASIGVDEYMVRFHNITNIVNFSDLSISKGNYGWNLNCSNNDSTDNNATTDLTFTVANSAPTTPTINPSSGTFDAQINVTCTSTDADADDITYDIEYLDNNEGTTHMLSDDDTDGNYTWNTTSFSSDQEVKLKCTATDGTTTTSTAQGGTVTIIHTGAPSTPTNLTCNEGTCTAEFNNTLNLTATGSNDSDGNFTYYFYATYDDVNGTQSYFIGTSSSLNTTNNESTITWNITKVPNQQSVTVEVLAYDDTYNSTRFNLSNTLTINNTDAPTIPLNLTNQSGGIYNSSQNIPIECNGSSSPLNSDLNYTIHALYDSIWNLLNDTLNNTTTFTWNFSDVAEQSVNISCQSLESTGKYVSPILRTQLIKLVKPPTVADNITPGGNDLDNVYENELNYSCTGANNSDFFNYSIEMNWSNGSSTEFRVLNDTFPAALPVNDSTLKYDDNSYLVLNGEGSGRKYTDFTANITNFDYRVCVRGFSSVGKFDLHYNCPIMLCSTAHLNNCSNNVGYTNLESSETEKCFDITLNESGNKQFCLESTGQGSNNFQNSIDAVTFTSKPITFNTSNLTPQTNVQLRCKAIDETGESDYLHSNNTIIIDRKPVYNGSTSVAFKSGDRGTVDMNTSFYDDDDRHKYNLTFRIHNTNGVLTDSYNFTTSPVITFSSSTEGTYYVDLTADDGLVNTTYNLTVSVTTASTSLVGGGGGGGSSSVAAVKAKAEASQSVSETKQSPKIETKSEETTSGAREESPVEIIQPETLVDVWRDTKITKSRKVIPGFGRTKIFEKLKNIDIGPVHNVKATITIDKTILKSASDIIPVHEFSIIKDDPVIRFDLGDFNAGEVREIQYILPTEILEDDISSSNIQVELDYDQLSDEELQGRERQRQDLIDRTKDIVNVTVDYNIKDDGSADIIIDVSLLNKTRGGKGLEVLSNIPKCLIRLLDEEFQRKHIDTDIEFDVIREDPMTVLNLGDIDTDKQFKITIDKAADIDCEDDIETESILRELQTELAKEHAVVNKTFIFFTIALMLPIISLLLYTSIRSEYVDKKKLAIHHNLVRDIKRLRKTNSVEKIHHILQEKGYDKTDIEQVIGNYNIERFKVIFNTLSSYVEFAVLAAAFIANFLEAFGLLPGDFSFYKSIVSYVAVGYLIYKVGIMKDLFGKSAKLIDMVLVLTFFLMLSKTTLAGIKALFGKTELSSNFIIWLLQVPALGEYLFTLGMITIICISLYLVRRLTIDKLSFASLFTKSETYNGHFFKRFAIIFLIFNLFYLAIFQLLMEWFTIIIDSIVMVVIALVLLFIHARKHHKKALTHTMEGSEAVTAAAYGNFFKLFRFHRTFVLGLAFIAFAFLASEAFIYVMPYAIGLETSDVYFAGLDELDHMPVFNLFSLIHGGGESLFSEHIHGLPIHGLIVIASLYILNLIGLFLLLALPFYIGIHIYHNIDLPLRHINKSDLPRVIMALLMSSVVALILTPIFKIKRLNMPSIAGVDIQTHLLQPNFVPHLLGVIISLGIIGYITLHIQKRIRVKHLDNKKLHYIEFIALILLCVGYITSYLLRRNYGHIPILSEFLLHNPTIFLYSVFLLSLWTGMATYYYSGISPRYKTTFEYVSVFSVLTFFSYYYLTYVTDITLNSVRQVIVQTSLIDVTSWFSPSLYIRFFVLFITTLHYILGFIIFIGAFLAVLYILYTRNELGLHKYNLSLLLRLENTYDLHHATYHIVTTSTAIDEKRLHILMKKIAKGIKQGFSEPKIIGHMLDHDWDINMIHEAVLRLDSHNKQQLMYAVYEFYSENIRDIIRENKHPRLIAQNLTYFDCPVHHIKFEVKESTLPVTKKSQIISELDNITKAKNIYKGTKDEQQVISHLEKDELKEISQDLEIGSQKEQERLMTKALKEQEQANAEKIKLFIIKRLREKSPTFAIVAELENSGYNPDQIEASFNLLENDPRLKTKSRSLPSTKDKRFDELRSWLEKSKKFSVPLSVTIDRLMKRNWKEKDIASVIISMKFKDKEDKEIIKYLKKVYQLKD